MNRILVIGGSGNVGRHVIAQLSSMPVPVRALVRNPEAGRFPAGVEIAPGDLTIPETLDHPLDGVDAVFLVWTAPPGAVEPALERIARRAQRIVFLSSPHKTPHPFFQQPNPIRILHEKIERQIETSKLQWTFLRPGMFSGNASFWWAARIRAGEPVRWPYLNAPTAPIDARDIAAVAVHALRDGNSSGAEYVLTGPQSLTQAEQISIIGRAIGEQLRAEEISPDEARRELPFPAPVSDMLLDAWAAALGRPALVTSTFQEITGRPSRTFFDWAVDHASEFTSQTTAAKAL